MDVFLYIILIILCFVLIVPAIKFLKTHRVPWPWLKTIPESRFRVLVALRRRSAGVSQIISMPLESHAGIRNRVAQQWQALFQSWSKFGILQGGFRKSEQGLPAGGDEDWFLVVFLDIPDYQAFRECISIIDDAKYRDFRNFCDVRLILGDIVGPDGSDIQEYF